MAQTKHNAPKLKGRFSKSLFLPPTPPFVRQRFTQSRLPALRVIFPFKAFASHLFLAGFSPPLLPLVDFFFPSVLLSPTR